MALTHQIPVQRFPDGREAVEMAQAGLKAFTQVADRWDLTVDEQRVILGNLPKTSYYGLLKGNARSVNRDLLERLSLLMGIWANLEILIPDAQASASWMKRPHPGHRFAGHAPLTWIMQGTVAALVDGGSDGEPSRP